MKKSSSLYKLDPFLDEDGVLRVGERLRQSSTAYDVKHPVTLPKKGHVTNLILCNNHQSVKHRGRGITQNEIRSSGYWIVGGSSVASNHISKCVSCRKLRGSPQKQKMANLLDDHRGLAPLFTFCAVDYFVPWLEFASFLLTHLSMPIVSLLDTAAQCNSCDLIKTRIWWCKE